MPVTIYLGYPVHSLMSGPVVYKDMEIKTDYLNGAYLHAVYLMVTEAEPIIQLNFQPDGRASSVRVGKSLDKLVRYTPDISREQMIKLIKQEIGETVVVPKPTKFST